MNLLNVDTIKEAKEKLEKYFHGIDKASEEIPIYEAVGRYLSSNVVSSVNIPAFSKSTMDGYAVAAKDTFGVTESIPAILKVVGQVKMGISPSSQINPGEAMQIPTGGMLPEGADAVVMVEYIENLDENTIAVYSSVAPNTNIMNIGDDFKEGQILYKKGHRITTKDIGMLAAAGEAFVSVFTKPKVAIVSTGDELVSIMEEPGQGQVRDINSYALAAMVNKTGARVGSVSLVGDNEKLLASTIKDSLNRNDLVLVSGGSSAGDKDYTQKIINGLGNPGTICHGLAIKPGKPTILGVIKAEGCCCHNRVNLVAGLPRHPAAAIVVYKAIVEYFIKKYYFENEDEEIKIKAVLRENIHGDGGRETFVFVSLKKEGESFFAEPIHAKSGSISQLKDSDGYIKIDLGKEGLSKGMEVEVVLQFD